MEIPVAVQKDFVVKFGEEEFNVTFRQATMGDDMVRSSLFSERKQSRAADGTVTETYDMDILHLMAVEVRLTLVSCDLTQNKRKMFKKDMDEPTFMKAWGALPSKIATLLHDKCIEVNPDWGFPGALEAEEIE